MKRFTGLALGIFLAFVFCLPQAEAAPRVTFVVLPFQIQGPQGFAYLEKSIPQMLNSRLYLKDQVEPAVHDLPAGVGPAASQAAAESARTSLKADYVVWGSVTVVGDDCSLDVRVLGKDGNVWAQARDSKSSQLIGAIKGVSDKINVEVFGRKSAGSAVQPGLSGPGTPNPGLVSGEDKPHDVYLNPQIRYSGGSEDDSQLRSQTLPFTALSMEVIDADNDGRNELILLEQNVVHAYRFDGPGKMDHLAKYELPRTASSLGVRALPSRSGYPWIIVNQVDSHNIPQTLILTFDGTSFKEEMKNVKFLLNVVRIPPDYIPTLVGQRVQTPKFLHGDVFEMVKMGNELTAGKKLDLPSDADVFNFTFLPAGQGEDNAEKLIILSPNEALRTYTMKGARLYESEETYSGSAVGVEMSTSMPGMGPDTVTMGGIYYMPMRMLAADLDRNGNFELLVNRPISTASQIFDRYRFFPQSELHSLYWDGIGMNLQWKTRRIKGSMVDYTIADANNDGTLDLVACLNTHPGALGVNARKCLIVLYPLDLSKADSNTPAHPSYMQE